MPNAHRSGRGDVGSIKRNQTTMSSSTAAPATSFHAFPRLPLEIATRIITLACALPPLPCSKVAEAVNALSSLAPDVATTLSLTTVTKSVGQLATSLLWEKVNITRPSALLELYTAVEKRPDLAERIKSLYIGGEGVLPRSDWPLTIGQNGIHRTPTLRLKNSLTKDEMRRMSPRWYGVDSDWPLEGIKYSNARHLKIVQAVQSALDHIDLDPYKRGYGRSAAKIGVVSGPRRGSCPFCCEVADVAFSRAVLPAGPSHCLTEGALGRQKFRIAGMP